MTYKYRDRFVGQLSEDIAALIAGIVAVKGSVRQRLTELAEANSPQVEAYWARTERGRGVPDTAFKGAAPYLFPEQMPARTFRTSGTSGAQRGSASYSPLGLELMNLSIRENARQHIIGDLERPAIVRFVPPERAAPEMVMAYGMEQIAGAFAEPELSDSVIGPDGVDFPKLERLLDAAVSAEVPVVLIGGSFAFVNICDALEARGRRWELPAGSRMVDAGGFKGRSRALDVDAMRALVQRNLGIAPDRCLNLFGMTELASQLYDAADTPVGPLGERPKGRLPFVEPRVRDPRTAKLRRNGVGLLEVEDLCVLDRPSVILTGDYGIASRAGVAITGRVDPSQTRGCSLALDEVTATETAHA